MSAIEDALSGKNGMEQQRIAETGMDWIELILKKNLDYGGSVWKTPLLAPDVPAGDAILVRMTDKIERIARLRCHSANVVAESLEDTIRDLGAYCLLWLARPKTDPSDWQSETEIEA